MKLGDESRIELRDRLMAPRDAGYKVTSMRITRATALALGIELNEGGFGEFEGVRIKVQL